MPIVPFLDAKDVPEAYRALMKRGTNTQRTIMHAPEGARVYLAFGEWIRFKSRFDPRLREMVILQVGYVLKNEYEVGHHLKIARDFGVTDADIRAILDETAGRGSGLPAAEATALRVGREMVQNRRLSDATTAAALKHFTPELLVELVLIAGFYNFVDLFLNTMRVETEDFYKAYLAEMPFEKA